jgi:hypothetical protein
VTTASAASESDGAEPLECWCCGCACQESELVRLGGHPEVGVCLSCAHFLHQQARGREDALRPSPASRVRDALRSARWVVIHRQWHQKPIIGRVFRWLGRRLPLPHARIAPATRNCYDMRHIARRSHSRGKDQS